MKSFNIVRPREDRDDPEKTYWDPIGIMWENDGKMWGQIYAIGKVCMFENKPKDTGATPAFG